MQILFIHLPIIAVLLFNIIPSCAMINEQFELLTLPKEIHPRIAAFCTPTSIKSLSLTCRQLNNIISFQTPKIWDIVCHSFNAMSELNLSSLLLKAHFCEENEKTETNKTKYTKIKEQILELYKNRKQLPFGSKHSNGSFISNTPFDYFELSPEEQKTYQSQELLTHILSTTHRLLLSFVMHDFNLNVMDSTISFSHRKIADALRNDVNNDYAFMSDLLHKLNINSRKKIWKLTYETSLPKNSGNCSVRSYSEHIFEYCIMFYKDHLNHVNKKKQTFLDYLIIKNIQARRDNLGIHEIHCNIIKKHGGKHAVDLYLPQLPCIIS